MKAKIGLGILLLLIFSQAYSQMGDSGSSLIQISGRLVDKMEGNFSATFQATPLSDVFRILSSESGLNMMVSPKISQTLSAKFKDVPIRDVFNAVLTANDLYFIEQGAIVKILTSGEYRNELQRNFIVTKTYDASIMDIKNLAQVLKPLLSPGIGNFMVDAQSSKIIVADVKENLPRVDKLFQDISVMPPMIELETKLLQIDLNNSDESGIDFSALNIGGVGASISLNNNASTFATAQNPSISASGAYVIPNSGVTLNAVIAAVSANHKSRVISQPKILALNREKANILIGSKVPYIKSVTTVDTTGKTQSSIDYIETGVKLNIDPLITEDGEVKLVIAASLSSYSMTTVTQDSNGTQTAPLITTTEVNCTTVSKDKQTIIIGGLLQDTTTKEISAVPVLGYIPILGLLFSHQTETTKRQEIVIFITPRVLKGGQSNLTFNNNSTNILMEAGITNVHELIGNTPSSLMNNDKSIISNANDIKGVIR